MKMSNPPEVIADVADDVSIHDLSVIDVIKDLYAGRIDTRNHIDTPRHMVEHVVTVIHFAVQQLHANRHALVFGLSLHTIQKSHAVIGSHTIVQPSTISGKGN